MNNNDCYIISSEVICEIARQEILNIHGICCIENSLAQNLAEKFRIKNANKGITVSRDDDSVILDIRLSVDYGIFIPDAAKEVQKKVGNAVEAMTGITSVAVNIYIQSIQFPSPDSMDEAVK